MKSGFFRCNVFAPFLLAALGRLQSEMRTEYKKSNLV